MWGILSALCSLHLCFKPQLQYHQCIHSVGKIADCHNHHQDPADYNLVKKRKRGVNFSLGQVPKWACQDLFKAV
uniref:Uncharacterized protein n=1 Tax=Zea mays TaxID=4577 RepID=C0HFL1_MAIZE|nr:unknown [Zea mays]